MFDRIRRAFTGTGKPAAATPSSSGLASASGIDAVSGWAATAGLSFTQGIGQGFSLKGEVGGKPWRMELGRSSRDYIRGEELRARAELGVREDAAVMLMNRPLKDALEKKAFAIYTDSLQTMADASLPEEMRWLSVYEEVGWDSLPREFWSRYTVLADARDNAQAWIDLPLARQLMAWPEPAPGPEVPFMLLLLRSKAYLRMQYEPADMATLQHAAAIFTGACDAAIAGLSTDVPL